MKTTCLFIISFSFLVVVSAALLPFPSLKATGLGSECLEGGQLYTISTPQYAYSEPIRSFVNFRQTVNQTFPSATFCVTISAPPSGVTFYLQVSPNTISPSTSFQYNISYPDGASSGSFNVSGNPARTTTPIFQAPNISSVLALESTLSPPLFLIASIAALNPTAGIDFDVQFVFTTANANWAQANSATFDYAGTLWGGTSLIAPLPTQTANRTQSQYFNFSFQFPSPTGIPTSAIITGCYFATGPFCTPQSPAGCDGKLLIPDMRLAQNLKSFSNAVIIPTDPFLDPNCFVNGINLFIQPTGLTSSNMMLTPFYEFSKDESPTKSNPGLDTGTIIGIAFGATILFIALVIAFAYAYRRFQRSEYHDI